MHIVRIVYTTPLSYIEVTSLHVILYSGWLQGWGVPSLWKTLR